MSSINKDVIFDKLFSSLVAQDKETFVTMLQTVLENYYQEKRVVTEDKVKDIAEINELKTREKLKGELATREYIDDKVDTVNKRIDNLSGKFDNLKDRFNIVIFVLLVNLILFSPPSLKIIEALIK